MILADPKTRAEWLEARRQGIGGSDAGCVAGVNPWKSARQLWLEKTGAVTPEEIGGKPAVKFGKLAEEHLRAIFLLTYPHYSCEYHEFRMHANNDFPFIFATLDGELTDGLNRRGILEIKTTEIQHASQWKEWDGRIPAHYYAQILHQMIACEWADYVELFAHIRYQKDGETRAILRKYRIEREDVVPDLQWLLGKETAFFEMMLNGIEPPYVLPEI